MAELLALPIAISHIQGRYLLFDINAITYLRKHYRICGVFIGTLPQNPSQNVFMGLPMEIMPEEAQVLIDEAVCYVVDDARAHDVALARANRQRQSWYVKENESRAAGIAEEKAREKDLEKRRALKKVKAKKGVESMGSSTETVTAIAAATEGTKQDESATASESTKPSEFESESLFEPAPNQTATNTTTANNSTSALPHQPLTITPSTSLPLLSPSPPPTPTPTSHHTIPLHPPSYTLYKHLHSKSYFQTPGLRFGCQFCVYPGDPLRFHSHFLAVGYAWDEQVDLMDLVGGGRLGTGVKKGWLVGGREREGKGGGDVDDGGAGGGRVRTWSVEWAGM